MAVAAINPNNAVVPSENGALSPAPLDVQTALAQQFIRKLRSRQANRDEIEKAEDFFRNIRFEDYEESSGARMMQFEQSRADEVIEKLCASSGWSEQTSDDLKFAAALLDEDRKAETWIKFQKGKDGEFYVHFVALRRQGEKVHMGLARHHVKFKLSPYGQDPGSQRRQEQFFYQWWENVDKRPRESDFHSNAEPTEQRDLSLHEMAMLENYFLLKAMVKFAETFPVNANKLPEEDRLYLTMTPADNF